MNLQFAIALSCTDTGCTAQPLSESPALEAVFPPRLIESQITVADGDLIVLDTAPSPPHVVFRWRAARAVGFDGDKVIAEAGPGLTRALEVSDTLRQQIALGDAIFADHHQVVAVSRDGRPQETESLRAEFFLRIEAIFSSASDLDAPDL